jgi:hypothetical protein
VIVPTVADEAGGLEGLGLTTSFAGRGTGATVDSVTVESLTFVVGATCDWEGAGRFVASPTRKAMANAATGSTTLTVRRRTPPLPRGCRAAVGAEAAPPPPAVAAPAPAAVDGTE